MLSILILLCVYQKLKKKRMEVKTLISQKREEIGDPVQMVFSGNDTEKEKFDKEFNEYLLRKFGTTDVSENVFMNQYKQHKEPDKTPDDQPSMLIQPSKDIKDVSTFRAEDDTQKRILSGDKTQMKEEVKDQFETLHPKPPSSNQETRSQFNKVVPSLESKNSDGKGAFLPPISGRGLPPLVQKNQVLQDLMFDELID